MKKCNNCGTKSCANNGKIGVPIGCNDYTPPLPQTNYDRLISKTPEELAEWIMREPFIGCFAVCPPGTKDGEVCPTSPCEQCWLNWLKSPVDKEVGG